MIQAKYFLDSSVKAREIQVDAKSGVVTLRGRVASNGERAQALTLARETEGVQRVEDALTVDASLAPQATDTIGLLPNSAPTAGAAIAPGVPLRDATASANANADASTAASARSDAASATASARADAALLSRIKAAMSSDARLKGTAIEVSVTNGVVLMQGTAPNRASKQRALSIARQADGAVQVVDRITAGSSR
jgi:osmotically-inducible protein OsmY